MRKYKYYWLKERHNPQIGIYWIEYGNDISVQGAAEKILENLN